MVDVAQLAGVSVSTVSHVLNGTRRVEPQTRERVVAAIEASGYRQDALARAMRRSQTESIGLVLSDAGEPAFAEMVRGIHEGAESEGLTLLVANSDEDPDRELRAIRTLLARRVDGLVLARVAGSSDAAIEELQRSKVPFVLMDRLADLAVDQVGTANDSAMSELVSHLAGQGHHRLALVVGDTRVPPLRERRDAFEAAVSAEGLEPGSQIVVASQSKRDDISEPVRRALRGPNRPTALIACSTFLAASALAVVQELALSVPRDLAFATFDGFAYPDLFSPHLTTVRQPAFEVGMTAIQLLNARIASPESRATTVRLAPTVEYRESTGDRDKSVDPQPL
jgi:LacI family transcriptional regulator